MRASNLGALALLVAGCNFSVSGLMPGTIVDATDLASDVAVDLAGTDDLSTMPSPDDMATPPPPPDLATGPDMTPPPTGLLSGAIAITSGAAAIDLTAEGVVDWAHWGTATTTSFDHKAGVTQQISNFTNIKNTGLGQLGNYGVGFSWSDGTPTASATNSTTGVYLGANNGGFRITAPADTTARTFKLYAGGQMSTASVTAHLSDGSAADYTTSTMSGPGDTGMQFERTVTLVYRALSAGQTLTVSWVQTSGGGFVHLHSATLGP